ncbi:Thymidylate kinase [compost metagenome]
MILDLEPEIGLARAARRRRPGEAVDRFEGETIAFHRKLRQAYLDIAAGEPRRCAVLDATLPPDELAEAAWGILRERLPIDPDP